VCSYERLWEGLPGHGKGLSIELAASQFPFIAFWHQPAYTASITEAPSLVAFFRLSPGLTGD